MGTYQTATVSPALLPSSRPGSPQQTFTVASGDFPTLTGLTTSTWDIYVWVFGQNTHASARTITTSLGRNGGAPTGLSRSTFSGSVYYSHRMGGPSSGAPWNGPLAAADTLEVYLHADVASVVNYEWVGIGVTYGVITMGAKHLYRAVFTLQEMVPTSGYPGSATKSIANLTYLANPIISPLDSAGISLKAFTGRLSDGVHISLGGSTGQTHATKASVAQPSLAVFSTASYYPMRSYG